MTQTNKDHLAELKVKRDALAYRIWAYCDPIGWDCTVGDCATALGVHVNRIVAVMREKNWAGRFRSTTTGESGISAFVGSYGSRPVNPLRIDEIAELRGLRFAGDDE